MDIAVVGAGVNLMLDGAGVITEAHVALGAVAPTALLVPEAGAALVGSKLDEAALDEAGRGGPRRLPARSATSAAPSNIEPRSQACWPGAPP